MESLTTFNAHFSSSGSDLILHTKHNKKITWFVRASLAARDMNPMNSSAGIFPIAWAYLHMYFMLHACWAISFNSFMRDIGRPETMMSEIWTLKRVSKLRHFQSKQNTHIAAHTWKNFIFGGYILFFDKRSVNPNIKLHLASKLKIRLEVKKNRA